MRISESTLLVLKTPMTFTVPAVLSTTMLHSGAAFSKLLMMSEDFVEVKTSFLVSKYFVVSALHSPQLSFQL